MRNGGASLELCHRSTEMEGEVMNPFLDATLTHDSEERRPLTYYQLLHISPDEHDPQVIEDAALRCSCDARAYQLTRESECTRCLNEIAQAMITLLDPVCRRDYDLSLSRASAPAKNCDVRLVFVPAL
jgi:hypothetical protein